MTPQDLRQIDDLIKKSLSNVATKADVRSIVKDELKGYATKDDMEAMKNDLQKQMGNLGEEILDAIEIGLVRKKDFNDLERKVDAIKHHLDLP